MGPVDAILKILSNHVGLYRHLKNGSYVIREGAHPYEIEISRSGKEVKCL